MNTLTQDDFFFVLARLWCQCWLLDNSSAVYLSPDNLQCKFSVTVLHKTKNESQLKAYEITQHQRPYLLYFMNCFEPIICFPCGHNTSWWNAAVENTANLDGLASSSLGEFNIRVVPWTPKARS